jgi:glucokinase
MAEVLWGNGKGKTWACYLTCGTGCGAGIMIDGKILRGPQGETPEAGHIRMSDCGPVMFAKAGCAESFSSGSGLKLLAHCIRPYRFPENIDLKELSGLATNGDADALAVIGESARRTGQLCALLADLFAPQVIILGSLARYLPSCWLDNIRHEFASEALAANAQHTDIIPAALGERLQDLSALAPVVFAH